MSSTVEQEKDQVLTQDQIDAFKESDSVSGESSASEETNLPEEEPEELEDEEAEEEITAYKIDLVNYLKKCGENYGVEYPLKELENRKMIIDRERILSKQVGYSRHLLFFSLTSMEHLTTNFLDPSFEGFSNHMNLDINSGKFDDDLRELCQKYASNLGEFGPELRLAFSLLMSAATFKIVKATSSGSPPPPPASISPETVSKKSEGSDLYQKYLKDLMTT